MCGIAGVIAERARTVHDALPPMVNAQRHRGPDDHGIEFVDLPGGTLGLGHRRLSILDLSPAGHQPMRHPQTGDLIVFNGEIYNYLRLRDELVREGTQFAGHSDTEVLLYGLRRWGAPFLQRLEGMFALAWYDHPGRRLLLARDPVGIKPLYLARPPAAIVFASEVRAVLASGLVPPRLDPCGVAGLLAYGAVQEPFTIVQGVEAVPPGSWLELDLSRGPDVLCPVARRFWRFPPIDGHIDEPTAVERLRTTLEAAVSDHLISDVPVGVFLSSGLDSTIVAALAARHTPRLRTFTVSFADQPEYSESELATRTARRIGAEHSNLPISGLDALAACTDWINALDQPSGDGLNTYIISKAVRAQGIVVALSGLGGDELLGGYKSFQLVPRVQRILRRAAWVPAGLRRGLSRLAAMRQPLAVREKLVAMAGSDGGTIEVFLQCRRTLSGPELGRLGLAEPPPGLTREFVAAAVLEELDAADGDAIAAVSRLESRLYMGNTLLRDSDANGMAHSLEIRVPMLDRRMLDLCYAIPGPVRLPPGAPGKYLLRRAFAAELPDELLQQKKRGFTLPMGPWMVGPLRELCAEGLNALKRSGILRPAAVDEVWQTFLAEPGLRRWVRPLTLVALGLYTRRLGV